LRRDQVSTDKVSLALVEPVPAEVPAGSELRLKVRAACPDGRDLRGGRIEVRAADGILASGALGEFRDGGNQTGELVARAPATLGEFTWALVFPPQEIAAVAYPEGALAFSFATVPHGTSLAVWDIPSPVPVGERLRVKVGAKSTGECALAGAKVEIRDASGARLGCAALGDAPLPQTRALYFAEVELTAPAQAGMITLTAALAADGATLPHTGASTTFTLTAVAPPAHRLTVATIEAESRAPLEDVQIGCGPYRAATDAGGLAHLATAGGRYELAVWKPDFTADPITVEISHDMRVEVALTRLPPERTAWD
jgi:hypothetical protein